MRNFFPTIVQVNRDTGNKTKRPVKTGLGINLSCNINENELFIYKEIYTLNPVVFFIINTQVVNSVTHS